MYAKLIEGKRVYPTNPVIYDNNQIFNPTDDVLKALGFMEIVETPYPEIPEGEEHYYVAHDEIVDGKIVVVWVEAEPPVPPIPVPSVEERVGTLEGQMNDVENAVDLLLSGEVSD